MGSSDDQYYDDAAGDIFTSVYDAASLDVAGTTLNSTPAGSTSGYPSGYSAAHIAVSAVVVTLIMLVIVLGNVLVVAT